MSKQGIAFLENWLAEHITEGIRQAVDGDGVAGQAQGLVQLSQHRQSGVVRPARGPDP